MEQKQKDKDVLIVRDEKTGEIGVVAGLKADGTPKMTSAQSGNQQNFLLFDKQGNVLSNFFKNFFRQCKEPKRFGFYRVAAEKVEHVIGVLKDLLKDPERNKALLEPHHVDTSKYEQEVKAEQKPSEESVPREKQQEQPPAQEPTIPQEKEVREQQEPSAEQPRQGSQPIDESRINWAELEDKYGIKREALEASGDLKKMLNYGKSDLMTVAPKFGEERFEVDARLSFKPMPDGSISLVPHCIRKEPKLDQEFEGHTFTPEDRENLKKTGNMGRVAELVDKSTGEVIPSYISIDRQTNELVSLPIGKARIPDKIGNTPISEQEKAELRAGHAIPNKEIELANGKKFTTTLQVNVEQGGVEFVPRQLQPKQNKKQQASKTDEESKPKTYNFRWVDDNGNIRAPKTFGGQILTQQQQADYVAKKAILVKDMVRDGQGKPYTAYIKFSTDEQRPKFYRTNPDISQASQITPAAESRTQVAVNTEGKTNEATKHLKKPLNQGQIAPTNAQQQERQNRGVQNKPKGKSIGM